MAFLNRVVKMVPNVGLFMAHKFDRIIIIKNKICLNVPRNYWLQLPLGVTNNYYVISEIQFDSNVYKVWLHQFN